MLQGQIRKNLSKIDAPERSIAGFYLEYGFCCPGIAIAVVKPPESAQFGENPQAFICIGLEKILQTLCEFLCLLNSIRRQRDQLLAGPFSKTANKSYCLLNAQVHLRSLELLGRKKFVAGGRN